MFKQLAELTAAWFFWPGTQGKTKKQLPNFVAKWANQKTDGEIRRLQAEAPRFL
jgi:hypothetical protein